MTVHFRTKKVHSCLESVDSSSGFHLISN